MLTPGDPVPLFTEFSLAGQDAPANRGHFPMKRTAALAALFLALVSPAAAQSGCAGAIAQFRAVIEADVKIGHLNKSVHSRIVPDLGRVEATCRAGKDAEATRALAGLKSRFGYR